MTKTCRLTAGQNLATILLIVMSMSGCVSQEDSKSAEDLPVAVELSGSVGDGPLVSAMLNIARNDGESLAQVESDLKANYSVTVEAQKKYFPLTISVSGGIDLVSHQPPDFNLLGAVFNSNGRGVANVNPYSTFAVMLAGEMSGGLNSSNLETAEAIVANELNSGLTSLAVTGPMTTRIDENNVSEIVKSSETLMEIMRRTRDLRQSAGFPAGGDQVLRSIGSDIIDRVIDGRGGSNSDRRTAAVVSIVSAQVLLEAMANELHVNGSDVTSTMREVVDQISSQTVTATIDELPVTPAMLDSVAVGLAAAFAVDNDPRISELQAIVSGMQPGMDATLVQTLLPQDYRFALNNVSSMLAGGNNTMINLVNDIVRLGNDLPGDNEPPSISGTPPATAAVGAAYTFVPEANDMDGDLLTFIVDGLPSWANFDAGTGRLSGTPGFGDVGIYSGISITVSDGTTSASIGPFSIEVVAVGQGSVTLSWLPPTENEDGSVLTDLAGYNIYWGRTGGGLSQWVTIDNPSVSTYVVDNLTPGTYEFVATSFNAAGIESLNSNSATRTVQ